MGGISADSKPYNPCKTLKSQCESHPHFNGAPKKLSESWGSAWIVLYKKELDSMDGAYFLKWANCFCCEAREGKHPSNR